MTPTDPPTNPRDRESWKNDERIWREFRKIIGGRAEDPMYLRGVERDGHIVVLGRCPGCGQWAELDYDQLIGQVSTHHAEEDGGCGFHETVNWIERYTA